MISIEHLTKRFGDFTAVEDLTMATRAGEIFGFLGPNGAGKTTTIRILAGLSLPTSGHAAIGGFDLEVSPVEAKALVGYVPDRPYLYEKLTCRELLRFIVDLYGRRWEECRSRADDLVRYFDLQDWIDARIESLSHGMKQKLVIITALVHDPKLLIIDEPMMGLDALAQRQVSVLLRRFAGAQKTVFLTTHTMSVAEALCDRIAILHRGRVVATGSPAELKELHGRPGGAFEELFLELTYGGATSETE